MSLQIHFKVSFVLGFLFIHRKEISFLPTPLSSINLIFHSSMSLFPFVSLILFLFSVIPLVFCISFSLVGIKYQIIAPEIFPSVYSKFLSRYLNVLFNTAVFLVVFWAFTAPYDPEDYFFLKYSSLFSNTAISNIYTAEIVICIMGNMLMFYFNVLLELERALSRRFPFIFTDSNFYLKNWSYLASILPILLYHLLIFILTFYSLFNMQSKTSKDIRLRELTLLMTFWNFPVPRI